MICEKYVGGVTLAGICDSFNPSDLFCSIIWLNALLFAYILFFGPNYGPILLSDCIFGDEIDE